MDRAFNSRFFVGFGLLIVCIAAYVCFRLYPHAQPAAPQQSRKEASQKNEAVALGYSRWDAPQLPQPDVDAHSDQWESEAIHASIAARLEQLRHCITAAATQSNKLNLRDFPTDELQCQRLRPEKLQTILDSELIRVRRLHNASAESESHTETLDFATAISDLLGGAEGQSHEGPVTANVYFKVIDIQSTGPQAASRVLVELNRRDSRELSSINATWDCTWRLNDEAPRLSEIVLVDYEEVVLKSAKPLLEDVTSSVLDVNNANSEHLLRGIDHWCYRLTHIDDMRMHGHHGIAIADVNGDGLEDIYACDAGGLPNRLYLQQADGTTIDYSKQSNTDWLESSTAAIFVDFDNDGDQDLAVTTVAGLILAANDGTGRFKPRAAYPGAREAQSICAADYDNDGDVDLYMCVYGNSDMPGGQVGFEADLPIPYSDANNGGANVLYRNDGGFRFLNATRESGLDENNLRWSFSAAWSDFDLDGDVDLYVANDFGRNNLYRNDGGKFRDVAANLGVEDRAGGMSAAWADFNRDGRQDLYIGNMFSAAGQRVTYQRRFLNDRTETDARDIQRMARGNTLFMANRSGPFHDSSLSAGVAMGRWSWGSKPVDLNNDGYDDLVVANGYFTNSKPDDL